MGGVAAEALAALHALLVMWFNRCFVVCPSDSSFCSSCHYYYSLTTTNTNTNTTAPDKIMLARP